MAAAARLPVIVFFASSEINAEAKKLLRKRWPGLVELGDVTRLDAKAVHALALVLGPLIDAVVVAGGSPCQDLSSLNLDSQGLQGTRSGLLFDTPRVVSLFQAGFPPTSLQYGRERF